MTADPALRIVIAGSKLFAPTLTSVAAVVEEISNLHRVSVFAKYPERHALAPSCFPERLDYTKIALWPQHFDLAHLFAGDTAQRVIEFLRPDFPIVITCESGGDFTRRIQNPAMTQLYEQLFARASVTTFVHESIARLVAKNCRFDQSRAEIFDPCLPLNVYPRADVSAEASIAIVGREVPEKGRAQAEQLLARNPDFQRAWFIGTPPSDVRLDERFEYTGSIPHGDYLLLLSRCRLLLYIGATSGERFDSLPTTFLEAFAIGVPVVSTPIQGVREMARRFPLAIRLGETPAQLSTHVSHILQNPPVTEDLSAYVCERFSLRSLARKFADCVYPRALGVGDK